jgi:hypothetical protein
MGALGTSKDTHISMLVPMTGYALSTALCYYVRFDEKVHHHQADEETAHPEKHEGEHVENVTRPREELREEDVNTNRESVETARGEETAAKEFEIGDVEEQH